MANQKEPSYFYIGKYAPEKYQTKTLSNKSKEKNDKNIFNPLFNFDKSFGEKFSQIKPVDVGSSQPFIDLKILDLGGKVKSNLNIDFFQKQINFNEIKGVGRYTDRPLISLKSVEITTDQSSGYIYFTNVTINLKIHKKDDLADRAILGLLFPGCPLLMEYGWNSKDEWLNKSKQKLLLNVVSYDITLDESGQADLTVKCLAFNDILDNTIIGDLNTLEFSNDNVQKEELNGLFANYNALTSFLDYLEGLEKNGSKNVNDYSLLAKSVKSYRNLQQRTEGKISENFQKYLKNLADKNLRNKISFGKKNTKIDVVALHDVIYTLCDETFTSMSALVPVTKFEVVYGAFNDQCLEFSGESIADFPIDYNKLIQWIRQRSSEGQNTIYVKDLLNGLCREFVENEEYLRQSSRSQGLPFQQPDIAINFINTGDVLTLFIIDAKTGIPPTTNQIKGEKKLSLKDAQDKILNGTDIPIISLGNANSFIKNVTFSRIDDAYMETVLIERSLNNSYYTPRSNILNDQLQGAQATETPLTLPLQGTARCIGHVGWMPFRAFYLSSGIFLIDAIYIIKKVTHTLSQEGFETQLEFFWH
jgi:hypothetical protein